MTKKFTAYCPNGTDDKTLIFKQPAAYAVKKLKYNLSRLESAIPKACWVFLLLYLNLLSPSIAEAQTGAQCQVNIGVNLTSAPDAVWISPSSVAAGEECCGMPDYYDCFELIVDLHPYARAFEVEFSSDIGEMYFVVNCEGISQTVPANRKVKICVNNPSPAVSVVFCRPGSREVGVTVRSLVSGIDISFPALPELCLYETPLTLNQASPAGGQYFINGSSTPSAVFNPSLHGVGEHTILYKYTDPISGCVGVAEQTIQVNAAPVISCQDQFFCPDITTVDLASLPGIMPSGGVFRYQGNSIETFSPSTAGPGIYTIEYTYTSPTSQCFATCSFDITVYAAPQASGYKAVLCDETQSGVVNNTDITIYENLITSQAGVIFSYYRNVYPGTMVPDPSSLSIQNGDVFKVKVENPVTGCFTVVDLEISLSTVEPGDAVAELCDQSADNTLKVFNINLSSYNNLIYPTGPGVNYAWFSDAALQNPVVSPVAEIAGPEAQFWVRVSIGDCNGVAKLTLKINPTPAVDCSLLNIHLCRHSGEINLHTYFSHLPPGGVFRRNNNIITTFNPINAGSFPHTYTLTDPNSGCSKVCNFNITVTNLPVAYNVIARICDENGDGLVTGVNLTQYESSLSGIEGNTYQFYQNVNHTIPVPDPLNVDVTNGKTIYVQVVSPQGCIRAVSLSFILVELAVTDKTFSICDASGTNAQQAYNINLNNYNAQVFPTGGGITYNWFSDEALTTPITGAVPVINHNTSFWVRVSLLPCSEVAKVTFNVPLRPAMTCPTQELVFCAGDAPFNLNTLGVGPSGGTFSGTGVTAGSIFNPSSAGPALRTITYSYTDPVTQCNNTCTFTIGIYQRPAVQNQQIDLCNSTGSQVVDLNDYKASINPDPNLEFLFFHDAAYSNPIVNPSTFTATNGKVVYVQVFNKNECFTPATITFSIPTLLSSFSPVLDFCDQSDDNLLEIYLTNLNSFNSNILLAPAEATYQWFSDAARTLQIAAPVPVVPSGTTFYARVIFDQCVTEETLTVQVFPLPEVECSFEPVEICVNGDPVVLHDLVGSSEGVFFGTGVTDNIFDPAAAGVGNHSVTYLLTSNQGCNASCPIDFVVKPIPEVTCPEILYFCLGGGQRDLNQALPAGGEYSGHGVYAVDGNYFFDPAITGVGEFTVEYRYAEEGCSNICTFTVSVQEIPDVACEGDQTICEDSMPLVLDDLCPNPGVFTGTGVAYNDATGKYEFDPVVAGTGIFEITHIFTHPLTELNFTCVFKITVHPKPVVNCSNIPLISYCIETGAIDLASGYFPQPAGGNFFFNNTQIGSFTPTLPGTFEIEYRYTHPVTECPNSCTFQIHIYELPKAENAIAPVCSASDQILINLNDYGFYVNDSPGSTFEFFYDDELTIPVANPQSHLIENGYKFYTRVTTADGCRNAGSLTFVFDLLDLQNQTIELCDASANNLLQAYNVNLHDFNHLIQPTPPGLEFRWFTHPSMEDSSETSVAGVISDGEVFYLQVRFVECFFTAEITFHILPNPEISCRDTVVCSYEAALNLNEIVLPQGGLFEGDWVTGNIFNIQAAGPGSHQVSYSIEDTKGCISLCTAEVAVFDPTGFACEEKFEYCLNAGLVELTFGSPAGGRYAGPGVTRAGSRFFFNTLVVGPGIHIIEYIIDDFGCFFSCSAEFDVRPLPVMSCPADLILCEGDDPVVLNTLPHLPAGGIFSGPYITFENGSYIFNTPQAPHDAYEIEYTFTNTETGCTNSCYFIIKINQLPSIRWNKEIAFCSNEGLVELAIAKPSGGIFSGNHVVDGKWFNLAAAGPGIHALSYTITTLTACSATKDTLITVHPSPVAHAGDDIFLTQCSGVNLNGSVSGGTLPHSIAWQPAALLNSPHILNPATLPLGGNTSFRLVVTDNNGCISNDKITVHVENGLSSVLNDFPPVCQNDMPFPLQGGLPDGGLYYINDSPVAAFEFNPAETGAGLHYVYYIADHHSGCFTTAENTVTVYPLPQLDWDGQQYCMLSGLQPLDKALPAGGLFDGNFVIENRFNTNNSGSGSFPVNYSYTDQMGCTATREANIVVHPLPDANAGADQTIWLGTYTTISAVNKTIGRHTYRWSPSIFIVSPLQQTTFTRELLYTQLFSVRVTNQQTTCAIQDEMVVYVEGGDMDFVYAFMQPSEVCAGDSVTLKILVSGGSPPYQFFWYLEDPSLNPGALNINPDSTQRDFTVFPEAPTTYYLKVLDRDGNEIFRDLTPTVNPLPVLEFNTPDPFCYNTALNMESLVTPAGGTFHLLDNTEKLPAPFDPFPFINTAKLGVGPHLFSYQHTDAKGCTNTTQSTLEVVNVVPAFTVTQPDICKPHIVEIENTSIGSNDFTWNFGENSHNTPENIAESVFTHLYPVADNSESYTIRLSILHDQCPGQAQQTVVIDPRPRPGFSGLENGCAPHTVQLANESAGSDILYWFWEFGDESTSTLENPIKTFQNTTNSDLEYTVRLTIASTGYQCTHTVEENIIIYPETMASFALDTSGSCSPFVAEFTDFSINAQWVNWDFGNGTDTLYQGKGTPFSFIRQLNSNKASEDTLTIQKTIWLERENTQVCSKTLERQFVLRPAPIANIAVNGSNTQKEDLISGCSPFSLNLSAASSENAKQIWWDLGDGNTSQSGNLTHTWYNTSEVPADYTVRLRTLSQHGCIDETFFTLRVDPAPAADFTYIKDNRCGTAEVAFQNQSSGSAGISFHWDFGNGQESNEENPVAQFVNPGTQPISFMVRLTVSDGENCISVRERSITVYPQITASITSTSFIDENGMISGCAPLTIRFVGGGSTGVSTYNWDFGNATSNLVNPEFTFRHPGIYQVSLTVQNDWLCSENETITVVVENAPQTRFSLSESAGCSPALFNVSYGFEPDPQVTYIWDKYGNGISQQYSAGELPEFFTLSITGSQPRVINPLLRAVSALGCASQSTTTATLYPAVEAIIQISEPGEGQLHQNFSGCSPLTLNFSSQGSRNASSWKWSFGDGTTSANPKTTHTFLAAVGSSVSTYPITLTATSPFGCSHTTEATVEVSNKPFAWFDVIAGEGCNLNHVEMVNQSSGATSWLWSFGDGTSSTDENPAHIYQTNQLTEPTRYTITLEAIHPGGCKDIFSREVLVLPSLQAQFMASSTNGCSPMAVTFTNQSKMNAGNYTIAWNYGDGYSSRTLENQHNHIFEYNGTQPDTTFRVTLTLSYMDICQDVHYVDITVASSPEARFSIAESSGCSPLLVEFENLSTAQATYRWDFGDGTEIEEDGSGNILHTFIHSGSAGAATFLTTLTATGQNGCTSVSTRDVLVYPQPAARFTVPETEGCQPLVSAFENLSEGASGYYWDFGDGKTSTQPQPSHTFFNTTTNTPLVKVVELTAYSSFGCADTHTETITVFPTPGASFDLSSQTGCAPFSPVIENRSLMENTFLWSFGDENTSTEAAPSHTWRNTTNETLFLPVSLTSTNDHGCQATASRTLTVYPEVSANFTTAEAITESCSPFVINFMNQSSGGTRYSWEFGDGSGSQASNPVFRFTNDGEAPQEYTVRLTAESQFGCNDVASQNFTVFPMAKAQFIATPTQQSYPNTTIQLENQLAHSAWSYLWDFGDGNSSASASRLLSHTYQWTEYDLSTKQYTISLRTYNAWCSDVMEKTITITSPVPKASFLADLAGCAPFELAITNNSSFAAGFKWEFGDGSISYDTNPQYTFYAPGTYNLKLTAFGDGGQDTLGATIHVHPTPDAYFEPVSRYVYLPDDRLEVKNISSGADYYMWSFGDGFSSVEFEPVHYFSEPGLYNITLTALTATEPQCADTYMLEGGVRVDYKCLVAFPNAFTPNPAGSTGGSYSPGNTNRQIFYPVHQGIEEYELEIYNRWGELIFKSNDPAIGWDGYVRGRIADMGVYVWRVNARCSTGRTINQAGDVTVIR